MARTAATISEAAYEALADAKRENESFTDAVLRLTDEKPPDGGGELGMNTLTEDHIADIADETAWRTAEELEHRFR
jgi:predicted CopG family antitoxin